MSQLTRTTLVFFFFLLSTLTLYAQILEHPEGDKSLSPYFFIKSDDPSTDQLPLKKTYAQVDIAGVIADVRVVQVYTNTGKSTLEAIYVFPASTRAAVYNMKMTIGERVIQAKIEKRADARKEYEQALAEGRTASLLEQQRPNVFQMNVGNILPGDEIKVELSYTELLLAESQIYEFSYPTVVGPRYSNQLTSEVTDNDRWVKNPYLHEGEAPNYTFNIDVNIAAGMPLSEIVSTSHEVDISYKSEDRASITLVKGEDSGEGNRDFILKYRLTGSEIEPGLLLYKGEKENFFLMMLQPPKRILSEYIPPREYIFIVDVSGSMNGFPLDVSKQLLKDLIGNLKSGDRFNVLLFAAGSSVLSKKSLPATTENIKKAIILIENERGGGGTELLPALKRSLALPRSEGFSRTVVIVTDGYVNVEKEAFDLIRKNLGRANMFAFGIGSSVNRYIIEGMARAGMGESFIVTRETEAQTKANKFREYISSPVLTQISYKMDGFDAYAIEPIAIPDVLKERPVLLFGKWRGRAKGEIKVNGFVGKGQKFSKHIVVSDYEPTIKNAALKYLWARYRITLLADYNQLAPDDERVTEITNLGLKYNLLTDYTSFVAADSHIRNQDGNIVTVRQPLPLPQGVSNLAVAGGRGTGSLLRKSKGWTSPPKTMQLDLVAQEEAELSEPVHQIHLEKVITNKPELKDEFSKIVKLQMTDLNLCYQKSASLGISGEINVIITLEKKGQVIKVKINSNDFNDKNLEKCIIAQIKKWDFSSLSGITRGTNFTCEFKFSQ